MNNTTANIQQNEQQQAKQISSPEAKQNTSRWDALPKEPPKYIYTKSQLLGLFSTSSIPEGFTTFDGITSEQCLEPVNLTNLFKFSRDA